MYLFIYYTMTVVTASVNSTALWTFTGKGEHESSNLLFVAFLYTRLALR